MMNESEIKMTIAAALDGVIASPEDDMWFTSYMAGETLHVEIVDENREIVGSIVL